MGSDWHPEVIVYTCKDVGKYTEKGEKLHKVKFNQEF